MRVAAEGVVGGVVRALAARGRAARRRRGDGGGEDGERVRRGEGLVRRRRGLRPVRRGRGGAEAGG